jgi:cytochrome P450
MAAGSIPHTLIQDDIYEGYFPPKGTILFANAWGIYWDEDEYELPDKFIPARFISNKYGI